MRQRDRSVREIERIGRKAWKQAVGYHIGSLSEADMYRYKTTFTGKLRARKPDYEEAEVKVKCKILNKFIEIGMPKSQKMAV